MGPRFALALCAAVASARANETDASPTSQWARNDEGKWVRNNSAILAYAKREHDLRLRRYRGQPWAEAARRVPGPQHLPKL